MLVSCHTMPYDGVGIEAQRDTDTHLLPQAVSCLSSSGVGEHEIEGKINAVEGKEDALYQARSVGNQRDSPVGRFRNV